MPQPDVVKRVKRLILGERDRVRLTGRHYDNARRLLLQTVDLLNEARIHYHVVYGTLLGLARDGDLIPWDIDVDLMIPQADVPALRRLISSGGFRGWRVCDRYRMAYDYAAWDRDDVRSITIKSPLLLDMLHQPRLRTGRKIVDLYVRYPDDDCEAWDTFDMVSRAPQRFFDGHEIIEFGGRSVHVPRHYREFLELVYGNWRVPDPGYDARFDDGTLTFGARRRDAAAGVPLAVAA